MTTSPTETKKSASFVQVDELRLDRRLECDTETVASDNAALAALGYKQEFKRAFSSLEVFAFSFSLAGIFPSIA